MSNRENFNNKNSKLAYEKTVLLYTREILAELTNNPDKLPDLLNNLEMSKNEFMSLISDDSQSNDITFYDHCLVFLKGKQIK